MTDPTAGYQRFFAELKRRRVFRVMAVYGIVGFVLLQIVDLVVPALLLPEWTYRLVALILLLGFPVAIVLAWALELTPEGVRRTAAAAPGELTEIIAAPASKRWSARVLALVGVTALLVGAWYVGRQSAPRETLILPEEPTAAAAPGIAVLPFSIAGSELEEWREGLVSLLSTGLDGAGGLRAINTRTVLARWDEMTRDSIPVDHAASLAVARKTGARYALLGSAVAIGPEVRLVADVYELKDGVRLGQGQVEGSPDSVLALVDRLSVKVLAVILKKGEGELPPLNLASVTTTSVPALKAYLEGEVLFRRAQFEGAIDAYTRAIAADSVFALAHFHLASAYDWRYSIQSPLARRHREAALRLVDRLPEREARLVRARHATGEQKAVAVEWLEEAVRMHPDDSEAWFLLGDAHLHTAALTGPEEADRAFRQAVELDPRFAASQPHAVELAFNLHADSALVRERLEQYGRIASGSDYDRVYRLAFVLAFGTADDRETALDTAEIDLITATQSSLQHPRHWDALERVLLEARERGSARPRAAAADLVVRGSLWKRGRLRQALEYLDHPSVPTVSRVCLPAVAKGWGIPIPQEVLEEALSLDPAEGLLDFILMCRGYIAADLARWDVHASTLRTVEELGRRAREAGDSLLSRRMEAAASELRGYAIWRQGDPGAALPLLEEARRESWYLGDWPGLFYRKTSWYKNVWPAHVHLELGQPGKAEAYFRSIWYHPLSRYRQGQIHQTLGEIEKAREAYEYFVEAWAEADPELQPIVEDARQRLLTLAK
jgi:tetratricopeptide (TPR) repeat protein